MHFCCLSEIISNTVFIFGTLFSGLLQGVFLAFLCLCLYYCQSLAPSAKCGRKSCKKNMRTIIKTNAQVKEVLIPIKNEHIFTCAHLFCKQILFKLYASELLLSVYYAFRLALISLFIKKFIQIITVVITAQIM